MIISHGYPGNRFLMSPIAENIASKGYVVVAIDHEDSTCDTLAPMASTLVDRSRDQLFVLNKIAALSKDRSSFLYGIADKRIKTAVAFASAGLKFGWMDAASLKGIRVPMLFIGGSIDDVVGCEDCVRATRKAASGVDRALLTFNEANRNEGAPITPPREAYRYDEKLKMDLTNHYIDAVWDNTLMNNISEHFITAWLGKYLKSDSRMDAYLDLVPDADKGIWAVEKDGSKKPENTYRAGFPARTANDFASRS